MPKASGNLLEHGGAHHKHKHKQPGRWSRVSPIPIMSHVARSTSWKSSSRLCSCMLARSARSHSCSRAHLAVMKPSSPVEGLPARRAA